jgi:P4 family phage/plasmid primase-like protien
MPAPAGTTEATKAGKPVFNESAWARKFQAALPPLWCDDEEWFLYDNGSWDHHEKRLITRRALDILPITARNVRTAKQITEHLQAMRQIPTRDAWATLSRFDPEDPTAVLVNVANGTLRVTPQEVSIAPAHASHLFRHRTHSPHDPKATCPTYLQILGEMMPDINDQMLFQLFAGYCLLPSCRFEVSMVLYGGSGTGKSTLSMPLRHALGGATSALSMTQICDSTSYQLPMLRWSALNLGTEIDTVQLDESTNFKMLVSGEPIIARPIYQEPFQMTTTCKFLFAANDLPRFKHGTSAELRRLRFIRFDTAPAQRDPTLKDRLNTSAELAGILQFALQGLQRLLTLDTFPEGGDGAGQIRDRFSLANDPISQFATRRLEFHPDRWVSKDDLAAEYDLFLSEHGIPTFSREWVFTRLYERYPQLRPGQKRVEKGARINVIKGCHILPNPNLED